MKILVTGGAGYIGSHVSRELARQGYDVRILDNLSTGHRFLARGFDLTVGDIRDPSVLDSALAGVEAIMHFAADSSVGESVTNPRKYFHNNSEGTLSLLDAALDRHIRNFIFSSTAAIYGAPVSVPIPESAARVPVNPYGVSKFFDEMVLEAYTRAYDFRFAALRYFNAAGADASGKIGELHDPETHLIPSILLAASGARPRVEIFGDDYPTPDGTCIRDYIHVSDLATGHVAALRYLLNEGDSVALNLGNGRGYSVREILAAAEAVVGKSLAPKILPRREGDPPSLIADASKAQQLLSWWPALNIHDMISSAWSWMQRAPSLARSG